MKWIKRLIVRLFKITPEDLPGNDEQSKRQLDEIQRTEEEQIVSPELNGDIKDEITNQLDHINITKPPITADTTLVDEALPDIDKNTPLSIILDKPYDGVEDDESLKEIEDIESSPPIDEEILPLDEVIPEDIQEPDHKLLQTITDKEIRIGIDFGTTTTAVSIKIGDDLPVAIPIGRDGITPYIPSTIYFQPGEQGDFASRVVVGEDVERFGDQLYVIRSVTRCLGCQEKDCDNENSGEPVLQFPLCNGKGEIWINENEVILPSQAADFIIREALKRAIEKARELWGINLTKGNVSLLPVNLGCSAKFNLQQREIILSVAKDVGLKSVQIENIVEEPILAGFAFSRFAETPEGRVLIYDFGGGTFDVAVIDVDRVENDLRVSIVATSGEN